MKSATTDGGIGMAQALGVKFLDTQGKALGLGCGQLLPAIARIDVKNYVYSPQKGATSEMVKELDEGLAHYAQIIERDLGIGIVI
jgi:glycerate kinase